MERLIEEVAVFCIHLIVAMCQGLWDKMFGSSPYKNVPSEEDSE